MWKCGDFARSTHSTVNVRARLRVADRPDRPRVSRGYRSRVLARARACIRMHAPSETTNLNASSWRRRTTTKPVLFFFLLCSRAISHARAGAGPCTHHHITAYEKGSSGSKSVTEFSLVCCLLRLCYDKKKPTMYVVWS